MAETWITITEDHVRAALSECEYETFASFAPAPGSTPILPGCIRRVVNRVRGDVAASGRYTLGPGGTVPPELESALVHVLRREVATRVPQAGIVFDKLREAALTDAETQLARVRDGKAGITAPETVSPTAPPQDTGGWGGEEYINFSPEREPVTFEDFEEVEA